MERTFVMIKPDGVQRGLVGLSIARLEQKGLKLVAARLEELPELRVMEQYREHVKKPFFSGLKRYIMSGPCMLMVFEGKGAVAVVRTLIGATNPAEACPGSIRGDFGMDIGRNVIHASDSVESAKREIALHFSPDAIAEYARIDEPILYE
ncbi:MAG: nucleoside-diphosphate kinase [Methanoregulaceae archaeon]|nr:nucleoside-diphosphate kinase [Methanoregulaceae archaeon]